MNVQRNMTLITGCVITFLAIGGLSNDICACRKHCSPPSRSITPHVPFFTIHQPIVPPGFPHKWISAQVVESFEENRLAVKGAEKVSDNDYKYMPAKAAEGIKFSLPMLDGDKKICVLSFDEINDMDTLKKYFLTRNDEGDLYTWTLSKDNILLVLEGAIPERDVRQYENALEDLTKR